MRLITFYCLVLLIGRLVRLPNTSIVSWIFQMDHPSSWWWVAVHGKLPFSRYIIFLPVPGFSSFVTLTLVVFHHIYVGEYLQLEGAKNWVILLEDTWFALQGIWFYIYFCPFGINCIFVFQFMWFYHQTYCVC